MWKPRSASIKSFQAIALAFSTFLKRLLALVRNRSGANGDSIALVVRRCSQCSLGKAKKLYRIGDFD